MRNEKGDKPEVYSMKGVTLAEFEKQLGLEVAKQSTRWERIVMWCRERMHALCARLRGKVR